MVPAPRRAMAAVHAGAAQPSIKKPHEELAATDGDRRLAFGNRQIDRHIGRTDIHLTAFEPSAVTHASRIRLTIGAGVPFGASTPYHCEDRRQRWQGLEAALEGCLTS